MNEPTAPVVSVVIVSFEVRECLRGCLTALAAARFTCPLDVWVVDNASTDGTADLVAAAYPWVHLLRSDRNLGFAAATNRALREAGGAYALLLNPDAVLTPAALRRLVRFLDTHPEAGLVAPSLRAPDGRVQQSAWTFPGLGNTVLRLAGLPQRVRRTRRRPPAPNAGPQVVDWVSGACLLARRAAIERVGMLDEAFFMYGEDVDWCRRFWDAGWSVWLDPSVAATHVGGQSAAQLNRSTGTNVWALQSGRNDYLYFRKHRGPRAAALVMAVDLATSALRWVKWAALGRMLRRPAWRHHAALQRQKIRNAARAYG